MGAGSASINVPLSSNTSPPPLGSDRKFKPLDLFGPHVNLDLVEVPSRHEPLTHIACIQHGACSCCGHYQPHLDSVCLSVAGIASDSASSKTALAAYFGEWSQWNVSATLEPAYSENQAFVLAAILGCLQLARIKAMRTRQEFGLRHAVIKTDSRFLYDTMTCDDFSNSRSKIRTVISNNAADASMLSLLEVCVQTLVANGIKVQFWLVSGGRNIDGHQLAMFEQIRASRASNRS